MPNRRSRPDAADLDGSESAESIESVAQDFAALVAVFEHQLELVATSDKETRSHILNAKAAAERGMILSQQLLDRVHSSSATKAD